VLQKWRQKYAKLKDFLTHHPEIVINHEAVLTPEESRRGFYSLFNAVLSTITAELFPAMVPESVELTKAYIAAVKETDTSFSIENTRTLAEFYRFVDDPAGTVANTAFAPLFDLLKGKLNEDDFEQIAKADIASSASELRKTVYGKWIVLSLMKLLDTRDIYDCSALRPLNFRLEKFIRLDHQLPANISMPMKTQLISWDFDPQPILTQPNCILRVSAAGKNKYVSIRFNFRMGTHRARLFPEVGDWVNVMDSFMLDSDFILLYSSDTLTDLALIAERGRVARPELVIRYLEDEGTYSTQWLDDARKADAILQPVSGLYIISKAQVAALQHEDLGDYMRYLNVGLDPLKLTPLVDALAVTDRASDAGASTPSMK
jgi:hypothetical protein